MSNILVVTEIRGGQLKAINFETLSAAKSLAGQTGGSVSALLLGPGAAELAESTGTYGAEKAYTSSDERLAKFSPDCYAAAVAQAVTHSGASVVLMGATYMGKDLLARAAQILNTSLAQDCTSFRVEGDEILFTRPMFAGKVMAEVKVTASPIMATLRSKSFKAEEAPASVQVETLSLDLPEPKAVVEEIESSSSGKLEVTEADIIVSGGRGMKGPEHWGILEELATSLDAATGCSRPVSDEGWRPHDEHIGQTGKTVGPSLYIACGISGAIQHIAGISSSKYILAINKDPEAPIFKVADYGIVGDVFEVLPKMTEEVKNLKAGE